MDEIAAEAVRVEAPVIVAGPEVAPAPVNDLALDHLAAKDFPPPETVRTMLENVELEKPKPEPATKKPLFWSAAIQTPAGATRADQAAEPIVVPPVLRNLQKCQACGFPVSQGRTFCVECEEKQWRGQRVPAQRKEPRIEVAAPAVAVAATETPETTTSAKTPVDSTSDIPGDVPASDNSTLFLSSAAPSESWLAANKYILGALLVVAIIIGAIMWLR